MSIKLNYSRQINLIGSAGQDKLKQSYVLVIGAGGLGCPVLQYLAGMGIGHIGIVDNDQVDITNLHRQILYTPEDIGKYKVEVAAEKINKQNPETKLSIYKEKLDQNNIREIINNFEIIVDCTDNFETKFLVHDTCYSLSKKLVQANIYQYEGNLHVFDFTNKEKLKDLPCLRCLWTKRPEDGCTGTCADVGVLGATAGVLGSLQAMEVSKLILGKQFLKNGEGLFVDLISQDYEKRRWKKNLECSLCGVNQNVEVENMEYKLYISNLPKDLIWIDLRSWEEIENFILDRPNLIHMPLAGFDVSKLDKNKKYLLVCHRGFRSNQLVKALWDEGYFNMFSLVDGIQNLK